MPEEHSRAVVLNVDDDELARYTLSKLLEQAGFTVLEAGTGEEALRLAAEQPVDVLILDVRLPDLDGHEVARRLKADPVTAMTPILHLSATARDPAAVSRGLEVAEAYLVEPVAPEVVLSGVEALLRVRRALQEAARRTEEAEAARRRQEEANARLQRVQEELQQEQRLLEAILQQLPAGVFIADAAGRIVRMNPKAADLTGHAISLHARVGEYPGLRGFRPDGTELQAEEWHTARTLRTGESVAEEEVLLERPDGSRVTVLASSAPIRNRSGRIIAAAVTITDVSERQRAVREREALLVEMERWRTTLDAVLHQMPSGVIVLNAQGEVVLSNEEAKRLTPLGELGSAFPVMAKHLTVLYPDGTAYAPEDLPGMRALRTGEVVIEEEMTLVRGEGVHVVSVSAAPLRHPTGEIVGSTTVFREVTQEKRAQQEREQQARLLATLVENTDHWLAYLDREMRFVVVNSAFAAKSPVPKAEMIGRHFLELFPDQTEAYTFYEQARDTGEVVSQREYRTEIPNHPELGARYLNFSIAPVKGREGEVVGVVLSAQDVTEQVEARRQIEEAERARAEEARFLETIQEAVPVGLAYVDRTLHFVQMNPTLAQLVRLTPTEAVGADCEFVCPGSGDVVTALRQVIETGEPFSVRETPRVILRRPEIGTRYLDITGTPITDGEGRVEGVVMSVTDVTDRVQARQRVEAAERAWAGEAQLLDAILENTDHWLAYLDREFRFIRVNAAFARAMRRPREEILGRRFEEVFPQTDDFHGVLTRVLAKAQAVSFRSLPRVLPNRVKQEWRYLNLSLLPVTDASGAVRGLVFSALDVTAQLRQREKLIATERARAELAEHLNDEIAHRVKNNLAMVSGLLQMQAIRQPNPALRAALRDSVARVRTFANIHEQMYTVQSDEIDLRDAIAKIAETNREVFDQGALEITTSGDQAHCASRAATNLSVVANELITNALKHGAPDADGVRHIALKVEQQGGELVLEVWNSGNPVPEDFDPATHTGMGLLLVLDLTSQYDGNFSLAPVRGGTLARATFSSGMCLQGPLAA